MVRRIRFAETQIWTHTNGDVYLVRWWEGSDEDGTTSEVVDAAQCDDLDDALYTVDEAGGLFSSVDADTDFVRAHIDEFEVR